MAEVVSSLEVILGLIMLCFTVVICIGMFGFTLIASEWMRNVPRWSQPMRVGALFGWPLILLFGLFSIGRLEGNAGRKLEHPMVLSVALNRRASANPFIRLTLCLWWWALGATVLLTGSWYIQNVNNEHGGGLSDAIIFAMHVAAHLGCAVSMNGCLLIGVFHLTGSELLTRQVSRIRVLLDLAFAFAMPAIDPALLEPLARHIG